MLRRIAADIREKETKKKLTYSDTSSPNSSTEKVKGLSVPSDSGHSFWPGMPVQQVLRDSTDLALLGSWL